jgi:hypothetical protein
MDAQQLRRTTRLNIDEYRVIDLHKKYGIDKLVLAYIRAAILGGVYTVETLLEHIRVSNLRRVDSIDQLKQKVSTEGLTPEQITMINKTRENIALREKASDVLTNLEEYKLKDILS